MGISNSERIVDLDGAVTGFELTGPWIYCICGKELLKLEKQTGNIICRKGAFEKEGFSRNLIADDGQVFIYDFCTACVFSQEDFKLLGRWRLGDDLSSDVCGMAVDRDTAYYSIRNGKIITLDRKSYSIKEFHVSDSSMWSIKIYGRYLVCGTVDGNLLLLDKTTLSIERTLALGRKNIGSLYICGGDLYAASHAGKLFKIRMKDFTIVSLARNAHKKMFHCVGLYENMLMTVSYPCSEIAFWDKDTLEKIKVIQVPLSLSGRAYIEDGYLYLSSRNILGIDRIRLDEAK